MTISETERDQLKAFKDHIESSKANFDSIQKIEFNRRLDSYYSSLNLKKSFLRDLVECENIMYMNQIRPRLIGVTKNVINSPDINCHLVP